MAKHKKSCKHCPKSRPQASASSCQQHTAPPVSNPGQHASGHGRQEPELGSLSTLSRWLDFNDVDFWQGALLGAAAVFVLTNESVQQTLFGRGQSAAKSSAESST